MSEKNRELRLLLGHLTQVQHAAQMRKWRWQDWCIERIAGGMNNLLFRATGPTADLAVKFTIRDARDRAGREWMALSVLADRGADLAPQPILLDRKRYSQPVVVQSWMSGESSAACPATDHAWASLCRHLLAVHTAAIPPHHPAIRPVVLSVTSPAEAQAAIRFQHSCLAMEDWPADVNDLVSQALAARWPQWPPPSLCFCRADPNIRNFIRRPGVWASVDWEYSGWGDPAFEIADFLVHAAHIDWPQEDRRRFAEMYCAHSEDPSSFQERIAVYEPLMLVWWTLRIGRYLSEVQAGRDKRLVTFSQEWLEERQRQQRHYLQLAQTDLRLAC